MRTSDTFEEVLTLEGIEKETEDLLRVRKKLEKELREEGKCEIV